MLEFMVLGILFFAQSAFAGSHSLKYFYTGTSGAAEFPEFVSVGMVDDEQFTYYNSIIRRETPRQEWMEKSVSSDYWDEQTQILHGTEQSFKANTDILTKRFNQTGGIRTLQLMYGCELDDDGTTRGFQQFGYDGEDYVSFDKQTLTWTAANQRGLTSKMRLDPDTAGNQQDKAYLEGTCIEWLKKYTEYGAATLNRKVSPEIFITDKGTESGTDVTCHVTGFFPRDIEVIWQNGGPRDLDIESGEVLPNEDGTYQVKKTLKVKKTAYEIKKGEYSCLVAHSSFPLDKKTPYDPKKNDYLLIIGVVIGIVLAVVVVGIGVFAWKKRNRSGGETTKYKQTSSDESSSTGSSNEATKA